jgi:hypothetical protein
VAAPVQAQVAQCAGGDFTLRTAYPNRAYSDRSQSLEAAGLVPNAVLMLRPGSGGGRRGADAATAAAAEPAPPAAAMGATRGSIARR